MKLSTTNKKISAIILCAGTGSRTELLYNKIFHMLGKKTVLEMTLDNFADSLVSDITLVIAPADRQKISEIIADRYNVNFCYGGKTRLESVKKGLESIEKCDVVVIHDCARPYAFPDLINRCIESALEFGSGVAAVKSTDTLKMVKDGCIQIGLDRECIYRMQTPQAFEYKKILSSYQNYVGAATDDSEVFSLSGLTSRIVEASYDNIKITAANDLYSVNSDKLIIGTGFDVHQTLEGQKLVLGGENIPHSRGLVGHSDADVLVHAIMDALLSAAALPDIGVLFPNTDARYKGINSMLLLQNVKRHLEENNFIVRNISAVIIAEKPKLSGYIGKMIQNIAAVLGINTAQVNISATTAETLGMIGQEKGIAASAVCLLDR